MVHLDSHPLKRSVAASLVAVCALLLSACGSNEAAQSSGSSGGVETPAPSGADLYTSSCASCHGSNLGGTDTGPSLLSVVYEPNHHSDDSFRAAIANGAMQHHWMFGDMPAVEGLSSSEVEVIIGHVRSEQQRQGFTE